MRELEDILISIISSLIAPLVKDILFKLWEEHHNKKGNKEKQD